MTYRRYRGYNRRALDQTRFEGLFSAGVAGVTFGADGSEGLIIVQLDTGATIVETSNPADLTQWPFYRFTDASTFGAILPIALEALAPTSTGARFQLRFAELVPYTNATWKLLIPQATPLITAANGAKLNGWLDPQHVAPPSPAVPWSVCCASFGLSTVNNWDIFGVSSPGAGVLDVDTGDTNNSPFSDLAFGGWTVSGGVTVTGVADLGGGILQLTLSGGGGAGTMIAVANGQGPLNAAGFRAASSWSVVP